MFEADEINILEEDSKFTRPQLGPKSYFEMQTVDFLLDLGQGCQGVLFRS